MEADDFYLQNSVSYTIAAYFKMFEKYYPKHEDLWRQNMWIENTKRQPLPMKKPFNLVNYHQTKDWKVLLIL
jgi:hypothetical protein